MVPDSRTDETPQEQLSRARAELERRLRAGEPCRAEEFLSALPRLASSAELAVDLAYAEFVVRQSLGQQPDPAEWYARFPQWREQLERQFQVERVCLTMPTSLDTVADADGGRPAAPEQRPRVGRYEVLAELDCGGMGIVYKVHDTVLGRVVALKMIRGGVLAGGEDLLRFRREAKAGAQVQHPNLVPVYEIGEHQGAPFFTMPYLPGGSLAKAYEWRGGDVRPAVALVAKVARAVQVAHDKGIVHRDLKPSNILLDEHGEPLVSDFGLAKLLDGPLDLTQPERVLGTPAYMAPEQAAGRARDATVQSDVWALGVILYELLTGQRPFAGDDTKALRQAVLIADPPRPRALRPELDRSLEAVVLKCLEKAPRQRYASARALADDLDCWLRDEPTTAQPEGWAARLGRIARRRWRPVAALFLLLVAAVVVALALTYLGERRPQEGLVSPAVAQDPAVREQALRDVRQQLAESKPFTFLDKTGMPAAYAWRTEQGPQRKILPRQPFRMEAWGINLLELLPEAPAQRCRFRAQVRHEQSNLGCAGLYVAYTQRHPEKGPEHWFVALSFAELGEARGDLHLRVHRYRERGPAWGPADDKGGGLLRNFDPVPADQPSPWHPLAIEVGPDGVIARWEEKGIGSLTWAEVNEYAATQLRMLDRQEHVEGDGPPPPQLALTGGLGLYVRRGSAAFQDVVVEPVPDP